MVTKGLNDGLKEIHVDIFECASMLKKFSFLQEFLLKRVIFIKETLNCFLPNIWRINKQMALCTLNEPKLVFDAFNLMNNDDPSFNAGKEFWS